MVLGQWQNVKLICGCHTDEKVEMVIHEGAVGQSAFYYCPKYKNLYTREDNACTNRISINEYEKMLNHVMDEKYTDDGDEISVKKLRWKDRGIEYEVLDDTKEGVTISVINNKKVTG